MHPLVSDFLKGQIEERFDEILCYGLERAIYASHSCLSAALDAVGESLSHPPDECV